MLLAQSLFLYLKVWGELMIDVQLVLTGLGAGVGYALTGFAKQSGQSFDFLKFGSTAVIGLAAGLVMALTGVELGVGYDYMIAMGAVPLVENLLKAANRKLWAKLFVPKVAKKKK